MSPTVKQNLILNNVRNHTSSPSYSEKFRLCIPNFLKPGTPEICFAQGPAHLQSLLPGDSVRVTHLQTFYFLLMSKNHFVSHGHLLTSIAVCCQVCDGKPAAWHSVTAPPQGAGAHGQGSPSHHRSAGRNTCSSQPWVGEWCGPANDKRGFFWLIRAQSCFISLLSPLCPAQPFLQTS